MGASRSSCMSCLPFQPQSSPSSASTASACAKAAKGSPSSASAASASVKAAKAESSSLCATSAYPSQASPSTLPAHPAAAILPILDPTPSDCNTGLLSDTADGLPDDCRDQASSANSCTSKDDLPDTASDNVGHDASSTNSCTSKDELPRCSDSCGDSRSSSGNNLAHRFEEPGRVQREKIIYLVRHAESEWNVQVDKVSEYPKIFNDPTLAGSVISGAAALTAEIGQGLFVSGHTDHKLSKVGETQAANLRASIGNERANTQVREPAEQTYYDRLLHERGLPVYCSPMLRALQTAHLAFPAEEGWGPIVFLRSAREVFKNRAERDCVGVAMGADIVDRAMQECELPGLDERVDWDLSDCEGQWWDDAAETEEAINERTEVLLQQLLDSDERDSCVCVTHSNLIRRLMMRHGALKVRCFSVDKGDDDDPHANGEKDYVLADSFDENTELIQSWTDQSWEFVDCSTGELQRAKVEKLQNCGTIGVRFVHEDNRWLAMDVCLMFGSGFQNCPVDASAH